MKRQKARSIRNGVFREEGRKKAPACQARRTQKLPHNSLLSATYIHTRRRREMCGWEKNFHMKSDFQMLVAIFFRRRRRLAEWGMAMM